MSRKKTPEMITVSDEALEDIKTRVSSGTVLEEDKKIILSILSTHQWLYRQLRTAKLSINRLKNLFGFSTEKRSWAKKPDDNGSLPAVLDGAAANPSSTDTTQGTEDVSLKK